MKLHSESEQSKHQNDCAFVKAFPLEPYLHHANEDSSAVSSFPSKADRKSYNYSDQSISLRLQLILTV